MSKLFLSLASGGVLALSAVGAQAIPAAPSGLTQLPSDVIQVAGGCGRGWHRGPVVVAPAPVVVVAPRPRCWWTVGPAGGRVRVCR
jgi:hypothetical protein